MTTTMPSMTTTTTTMTTTTRTRANERRTHRTTTRGNARAPSRRWTRTRSDAIGAGARARADAADAFDVDANARSSGGTRSAVGGRDVIARAGTKTNDDGEWREREDEQNGERGASASEAKTTGNVLEAKGTMTQGRELNLPMQSASARKRVGRTRLLRTPMAGGVVSRDTKDRNLPSMATAARNLMELADYGDLSTMMSDMHHRRAGYPFGSTVDFATDATGHPIFCLAPLAIHTRNIAAEEKCSLTVKMSGWGGLANARVTIFGDVQKLPKGEYQTAANEIFKAKYHARKEAIDMEDRWGDYTFYRMNRIVDVYFVGGFGTLNWIKLDEYMGTPPDTIVTSQNGRSVTETLSELNTRHAQHLTTYMSDVLGDLLVDDVWIISIDRRGMDVRVRTDGSSLIRRISFESDVETFDEASRAIDCALANDKLCSTEF